MQGRACIDNGGVLCYASAVRKTVEYRIYPTKKQDRLLSKALAACRWRSHHLLQQREETGEQIGTGLTLDQQQATLPLLEQAHPSIATGLFAGIATGRGGCGAGLKASFRRQQGGERPGSSRFGEASYNRQPATACNSARWEPLSGVRGVATGRTMPGIM